jgi:hypothetical protein
MARHPLTLHAAELPAGIDEARAQLRAFVDSVFAHLPAVLPSHLDHPQWDYHRSGFIEARHKYLSTRLGSATETSEPPDSLGELDKVWWKLDGLTKSHARRRGELVELMNHQRGAVNAIFSRIEEPIQLRRSEIDERLVRQLADMPVDAAMNTPTINRVVECDPKQTSELSTSDSGAELWMRAILQNADEWLSFEKEVREKKEYLTKANEFIDKHYKERLLRLDLEFQSARDQLQSEYDRLLTRRVVSAAIPHVIVRHGEQTPPPAGSGRFLSGLARELYYRYFGKLPRVQRLHPYWAAMRHLIRVVDTAAEKGAADVLVVVGSNTIADTVADGLPGRHAQVAIGEVLQGNLAKAFSQPPDFDLCICTLGPAELNRFADIVRTVAPCMRSGGKIVGFYPNFGLGDVPTSDIDLLQRVSDLLWNVQIYYAGSEKSARVVQRFHRALWTAPQGRLGQLLRIATMLFIVSPSAAAANQIEAAAPTEQSLQLPKSCTSITIEVTV